MQSENEFIAMDMGGTKVHIALVKEGKIVSESKFSTSSYQHKTDLLQAIMETLSSHFGRNVKGIGIGVPGLVDEENGIVYDIQNIDDWDRVPLKDILSEVFPVDIRISNDANLFALGEQTFGKGQAYQNVLGISLGTGIGAGLILNGKRYTGKFSGAGEIGSIPYLDKTIEDYCSGKFFRDLHQNTGEHFAHLAASNDQNALALFNELGMHLGKMIKLLLFVLAPEVIIFGGSISKSFALFEPAMRKELENFPFQKVIESLHIARSEMDNAALLGAAFMAENRYKKQARLKAHD